MTLQAELEQLERAQLVRRAALGLAAQAPSEVEYLFKHVLVQELSYESLLRQDRKNLHFLVASALERDPAFRSDEAAAILARYWDQAGEPARAVNYYIRAGDAAARVYANAEALMAYDRAVELAASLELDSDQAQHLYVQRGRSLELQGSYDAALANYLELETWARAAGIGRPRCCRRRAPGRARGRRIRRRARAARFARAIFESPAGARVDAVNSLAFSQS